MKQILLFPDPSPLVERLGLDFFRQLPERPGVYLMKGTADKVLYVGKAKNLRRRLASYRVANPDRMPRRHLRLVRAVEQIDVEECQDESAALQREAELLRTLRPRFNRAGTWPGTPKYLAWKLNADGLQLAVTATPEQGWRTHGPLGGAIYLRAALVRLLWSALSPARGISQMPAGWFRAHFSESITFNYSPTEAESRLNELFAGQTEAFTNWINAQAPPELSMFDKAVLEEDSTFLVDHLSAT
jgi:predicted GIY-YIG superfamily endonuclease